MTRQRNRRRYLLQVLFPLLAVVMFCHTAVALAQDPLKVGVLKFGTVNWQLDSMTRNAFDTAQGLQVIVVPLASKNATSVALQAGEVDMIVSDWIWVLRQRASGADFLFTPYSTALGAIVVRPNSDISKIEDLAGKRLGIAGGPLDKSWLILQNWAQQKLSLDLSQSVEVLYAAPPLLNEQLRNGDLDAVLTFWPFAARLKAQGFERLLGVSDVLQDIGITESPSLVGYVFSAERMQDKTKAFDGFFKALDATNVLLASSDAEWAHLRPLMKSESQEVFEALKAAYRAGIPATGSKVELDSAERLFDILAHSGGKKLLGQATRFDASIFLLRSGVE